MRRSTATCCVCGAFRCATSDEAFPNDRHRHASRDNVHEDGSPERLQIDTIRTLAMDAVQKANSGHPGTPMALAPVGWTLWTKFLRYDPSAPDWPNRDRFVLSVGHASMLLYALLHLAGRRGDRPRGEEDRPAGDQPGRISSNSASFRPRLPATPNIAIRRESRRPPGRSARGCGNSVGMAIAERWLAARYNKPGLHAVRPRRLRRSAATAT